MRNLITKLDPATSSPKLAKLSLRYEMLLTEIFIVWCSSSSLHSHRFQNHQHHFFKLLILPSESSSTRDFSSTPGSSPVQKPMLSHRLLRLPVHPRISLVLIPLTLVSPVSLVTLVLLILWTITHRENPC